MEVHIGKEIERKYHKSGLKLAEFAKRLDTSTRNVYSIFNRADINSAQLKKISEILQFDFFKLYQNNLLKEMHEQEKPRKIISITVELDGLESTLDYWFDVLRKVNAVI